MKAGKYDRILLAHGGGGQLSQQLLYDSILPSLGNDILSQLADSAILDFAGHSLCFTTDSYVVKPLFFNGGDIGKLAVCGTINDLAVAGARPIALSLSLVIEEGLEMELLQRILSSVAAAAQANGVKVVAGDTKTVEAGAADRIFVNTAGLGEKLAAADLRMERIKPGDRIIINGTIGDHGMTIISQREGIKFESDLVSDCAAVAPLTMELLEHAGAEIKFMRDPTRGGLAATLNEIAVGTGLGIEIRESAIPVKPTVRAAADMLGFDVLSIANEGKFVAVVSGDWAQKCVEICRAHPLGKDADIIGEVIAADVPTVEMLTAIGGRRMIQMPYGRELPRIC